MTGALHVWRIDNANTSTPGELERVTDSTEIDGTPYVSQNGHFLVVARGRTHHTIWTRDLKTGTEQLLLNSAAQIKSPLIEDSTTTLVYEQVNSESSKILAGKVGGDFHVICDHCDQPTSWFKAGRSFFYRAGTPSAIFLSDVTGGHQLEIIKHSSRVLGDASWSETNRCLLFTATNDDKRQIFAIELDPLTAKPLGEWIQITAQEESAHHPRWSGDGRTIFYVATRNGTQSLYAQLFSPKKPNKLGFPLLVTSLQNQRRTIDTVTEPTFNISTSGNTVFLNLGEQNSIIQLGMLSTGYR